MKTTKISKISEREDIYNFFATLTKDHSIFQGVFIVEHPESWDGVEYRAIQHHEDVEEKIEKLKKSGYKIYEYITIN